MIDASNTEKRLVCMYCRREIQEGERKYHSNQEGMKGDYHWQCFVDACHHANRVGAKEIDVTTENSNSCGQNQDNQ